MTKTQKLSTQDVDMLQGRVQRWKDLCELSHKLEAKQKDAEKCESLGAAIRSTLGMNLMHSAPRNRVLGECALESLISMINREMTAIESNTPEVDWS